MKWFKKDKENKKKEIRRRDLLLVNFIIIMFIGILIAMVAHVQGIAVLLLRSGGEEEFLIKPQLVGEVNVHMNNMLLLVLGVYSLLHCINYGLYLFDNDKYLKIFMGIDALIYVGCIACRLSPIMYAIYLVPILSGYIYLKILKLEE